MNRSLVCWALGLAFLSSATFSRLHAQQELITNPSFDNSLDSWTPMNIQGAAATFEVKEIEGGKHAVCITVPSIAEKRYFVQLDQAITAPLSASKTYLLAFRAKAKPGASIVITIGEKGGGELWRQDQIALSEDWKDFSFPVTVSQDGTTPFLNISGLAAAVGEYWFTSVSLKEAPATGTADAAPKTSGTP